MTTFSSLLEGLHRWAELWRAAPAVLQYVSLTLFGLVIGSFLTVVVHRLPIMLERAWCAEAGHVLNRHASSSARIEEGRAYNLWQPRSHCPACRHTLTWLENVPLLSYTLLRGRCAACRTSIPIRYFCLEWLSAASAALVFWRFGLNVQGLAAYGLMVTLLALAWIDFDTHLLPDVLTLPLLWIGLLINLKAHFAPLAEAVIGASAGYASLWLIAGLFRWVRKQEGMGRGDFKLLAALGAWFGWTVLPAIVLFASSSGALFGVVARVCGWTEKNQPLPFGPFLAAAGMWILFWPPTWLL